MVGPAPAPWLWASHTRHTHSAPGNSPPTGPPAWPLGSCHPSPGACAGTPPSAARQLPLPSHTTWCPHCRRPSAWPPRSPPPCVGGSWCALRRDHVGSDARQFGVRDQVHIQGVFARPCSRRVPGWSPRPQTPALGTGHLMASAHPLLRRPQSPRWPCCPGMPPAGARPPAQQRYSGGRDSLSPRSPSVSARPVLGTGQRPSLPEEVAEEMSHRGDFGEVTRVV